MKYISKIFGIMALITYPTISASTNIDPADIHSNTHIQCVCYSEKAFNIHTAAGMVLTEPKAQEYMKETAVKAATAGGNATCGVY